VVANTEKYDGSAWTSSGNMITARRDLAGAGTQTAGLAFGGANGATVTNTEAWTGSVLATRTLTTS
jgi:hypothetical protein